MTFNLYQGQRHRMMTALCSLYRRGRSEHFPETLSQYDALTMQLTSGFTQLTRGKYLSVRRSTFLTTMDGAVYVCGENRFGELGLRHNNSVNIPTLLTTLPKDNPVVEISCGSSHIIFRLANGTVYACGINNAGQLGLGHNNPVNTPTPLTTLPKVSPVVEIACGYGYTVFRLENGAVYSCGLNHDGELGLGHNNFVNIPTQLTVSCQRGHLEALELLPHQLNAACQEGHLEVVKSLLQQPEIDVNLMDSKGWTPLTVA